MTNSFKCNLLTFIICLCFLFSGLVVNAQQKFIDSLENELSTSSSDTNKINTLNLLAFTLRMSDSIKAKSLRNEAFILSNKFNYTKGKGWFHLLEGINLTYQNKFLPALNAEAKAIEFGKRSKDYELVARAYNTIGLNHLRLEDDYNAMKAFTTGLAFIKKAIDRDFRSALLFNVGSLYSKQKRYKEALNIFNESVRLNLLADNKSSLSLNYLEIGIVFLALKDYDKAISNGNLALTLARETDYTRTEVNALSLLGSANLKLNNLSTARKQFDESASKATLKNMQREKLHIYNGYADLFEKEGNYRSAFLYHKKYNKLYDSLFNASRSRFILEYQEKFETQQKETENKLLRNKQLDTEAEMEQKSRMLNLTFGILAISLILSGVIFWGNRRIKETNRLLTEQKNEIQLQKDNVEQLNAIKDKLFSVIAHDLRSPFASMKTMMDMYDDGMISKDDVDYFFKELRRDIGSNALLLDNLLIWAKSQLHGFKIQPKAVAMEKVVDEISYYYKKNLENKEIEIVNKLNDNCIVHADHEMVKSIIRNLVGNAIKFTPRNGSITVSYLIKDDQVHIAVTDSGIGIPEDKKEKLFQDTFFTTQGLSNEKGTGLGLQICKEFVEKNNGRIWVESETDKGSSFWFTLPASDKGIEETVNNTDFEVSEKSSLKDIITKSARFQNKYDRYELLLKASNDTIWDWDLISNDITWSETLESNFGYSFEKTSLEWWSEKIHPEDLARVEEVIYAALRNKQLVWETEYRFQCEDSAYKYVLDRGLIVYDEKDEAVRMVGIMLITDAHKNAVREIQRLSLVATNVNNLVIITDTENRIVWVNNAFENFTGFLLTEVIGESPLIILGGEKPDEETLKIAGKDICNKEGFSTEVINYTKAGDAYWVQIDCTPYDDPVTNQKGYVSIHTIITDRKLDEQRILKKNKALREIARINSHEVRNPLSSILGLVKMLKNNPDPAERDECLRLLDESAEQLDVLVRRVNTHISEIESQEG
ncbi:MAG TPA: ATP-binding protein [Sphingobacteriaceae bacterium]|nr:ATP-binding protein [Sphingobacteriaceae bacterium]